MRGQRRRRIKLAAAIAVVAIVTSAIFYLRSDRFKNTVRTKVITELERATGGQVTLRSFTWRLSQLEFVAEDLTIHGLEPPGEVPYAHIDYLKVRVKILSILDREIGLRYVQASRPVVHIIVNADGTTNQPTPKVKRESGRSPADLLFDLAIDRLEVADGLLIWNDRKIPLDFTAEKVSAEMTYDLLKQEYAGKIAVGTSQSKYATFRPLNGNSELQFTLTKSGVDIRSFRAATPGSQLEASGRVVDLDEPRIELDYNATLDLAELAATARVKQLRSGFADVQGKLQLTAGAYRTSGQVVVKNLSMQTGVTRSPKITAAAQFALDKDNMALTNLVAQAFGGRVTGTARVADWSTNQQRGTAELHIANVAIRETVNSFSTDKVRLDRLNASGTANGDVTLRWSGSPANSVAMIALKVAPPKSPAEGELPVTADLRGRYAARSGELEIEEATLSTPNTSLGASGTLGDDAEIRLKVHSRDLGEFEPALEPLLRQRGGKLPVGVRGDLRFDGTLTGRLTEPSIRGRLTVTDFDSRIAVADTAASRPVHWDALTAEVDYSSSGIQIRDGDLRRGNAQLLFSGGSALTNGKFLPGNALNFKVNLRDGDIADLQAVAGTVYPVTGKLDLEINGSGTSTNLSGGGKLQIANGTIYAEPFRSLSSDIHFAGREVQLNNLALSQNGAQLNGALAYELTKKAFRFEVRGADIDLAQFEQLRRPQFTVLGKAQFQATGSGTMQQPTIQGDLRLSQVVINNEPVGDITAEARTVGRELQLTARASYEQALFTTNGKVGLHGDFPANIDLKFDSVDVDPGLRLLLGNRLSGHSSLNGTISIRGPLKRWRELTIDGRIPQVVAEVEGVRLTNHEPIVFHLKDGLATIEDFHLKGEGTDLQATGTVQLTGARNLNLKASGNANLKLLQAFNRDLLAYGNLVMAMNATGTTSRPVLEGQLQVQNGGVSFIDLPNGLSEINGTLVFDQNRARIQTLTAKTGGGTVELGGFISYRRDLYFNLTATGRDVRFRYPPGVSSAANLDLRFTGTTKNSVLSGDILVTRFSVNPRFDFALYLARSKQPPATPTANPVLGNLKLDVRVTSTPELRVETSLAKVAGDADLRIRGTAAQPAVLGRINIVEGDVFFNGTRYNLERGDVSFSNPVRIEPILNVEASARVREYDITLGFHGSVDKLSTTYRSEPPLPTADIIALLALGRTREESAQQSAMSQSFTETASNAILGQALDAAISSRVQKLFGVSRIKIDPEVGGPTGNPNARLTIEQQVSNNVTLTYITDLTRANQQIIQGEFNVTRDVSLIIVRDQYGVLGFDVKVRQRLK